MSFFRNYVHAIEGCLGTAKYNIIQETLTYKGAYKINRGVDRELGTGIAYRSLLTIR
jgi:hypothetical protein